MCTQQSEATRKEELSGSEPQPRWSQLRQPSAPRGGVQPPELRTAALAASRPPGSQVRRGRARKTKPRRNTRVRNPQATAAAGRPASPRGRSQRMRAGAWRAEPADKGRKKPTANYMSPQPPGDPCRRDSCHHRVTDTCERAVRGGQRISTHNRVVCRPGEACKLPGRKHHAKRRWQEQLSSCSGHGSLATMHA